MKIIKDVQMNDILLRASSEGSVVNRKIGRGYSQDREKLLDRVCLNIKEEDKRLEGEPSSIIIFSSTKSYEEVEKELSLEATVKVKVLFISGSISEKFGLDIKDTRYSSSYTFSIKVQLPVLTFKIEEYGLDALEKSALNLYNVNKDKFREECGDMFVLQEYLSMDLYISAQISFATHADKVGFGLKSGKILNKCLNLNAEIGKNLDDHNAKLKILLYQNGGEVEILKNKYTGFNWDKGYGDLKCEGAYDKCNEIMNSLLRYANEDFPQQISYKDGVLVGNPNFVAGYYLDYSKIGIKPGNSTVTKEISAYREGLESLYEEIENKKSMVESLLLDNGEKEIEIISRNQEIKNIWNSNKIEEKLKEGLEERIIELKACENEIRDNIIRCYTEPKKCEERKENYNKCKEELEVESNTGIFEKAYQITSMCNNKEYGPRYILPIKENNYLERSESIKGDKSITTEYEIERIGEDNSIKISIGGKECMVMKNNEGEKLVLKYEGLFYDECAKAVCPEITDNTYVTLLYMETPI